MTDPRVSPVELPELEMWVANVGSLKGQSKRFLDVIADLRDCRAALAAADQRIANDEAASLDQMNMIERLEREKAAAEKDRDGAEYDAGLERAQVEIRTQERDTARRELADCEAALLALWDATDIAGGGKGLEKALDMAEAAVARARARKP